MTEYAGLVLSVDSTDAVRAAEANRDLARASKEVEAAEKSRIAMEAATRKEIDGVIKALERDIAIHGKTRAEILDYDLTLRGATEDEKKRAAALARTSQEMKDADNKQTMLTKGMGFLRSQVGMLTAALSVGAIVHWIQGAIDGADAMDELAEAAALTRIEYAKLSMAIDIGAANGADMKVSMKEMNQALSSGSSVFAQLGINIKDANGNMKSAYQATLEVADAFTRMDDEVKKADFSTQLFGRSGAMLLPLLNQGAKGIENLGSAAAVASDQLVFMSGQAEINGAKIGGIFNTVRNEIAETLLPKLNDLSDWFIGFAPAISPFLTAVGQVAKAVGWLLVGALKAALTSITLLVGAFNVAVSAITTGLNVMASAINGSWDDMVAASRQGQKEMVEAGKQTMDQLVALYADDAKESKKSKAQQAADEVAMNAERLGAYEESLKSQKQLEVDNYGKRLVEAQFFAEKMQLGDKAKNALIEREYKDHLKRMKDIAASEAPKSKEEKKDTFEGSISVGSVDIGAELSAATEKHNQMKALQAGFDAEMLEMNQAFLDSKALAYSQSEEGILELRNIRQEKEKEALDAAAENELQRKKMMQEGISAIGRLLEQASGKNRNLARAAVAFNKIMTLMMIKQDTARAAVAAAAAVAGIPIVGPALAVAAKGTMYLLGAAAAASVMSGGLFTTGDSGGGTVNTGMGGASSLSPEGGTVGTVPSQGRQLTVNVVGIGPDTLVTGSTVKKIMDAIGERLSDGGKMGNVKLVMQA